MKMYHATNIENLSSILEKGILRGFDGIVYLAEKPEYAARFLKVRLVKEILVIEVDVPEEKIEEQFDHNEKFFGCKAFGYPEDIPVEMIGDLYKFE